MKKIIITAIVILLGKVTFAQQDAQYSQYMFNGIYINPAYAGYKETLNLHAFYRNQWSDMPGSPRSFSVAVDAIANEGNVGLALQLAGDKFGAQNNLSAHASYAYRIRMNEDGSSRLAFGLSGGLMQLGLNGMLLNPNDPEPDMPAGNMNTIIPDARVGVYFSNNNFFAGFSMDNMISQYMNSDKFVYIPKPKTHYYLTAGALVPLNEVVQLKPSFLLKDDRGGPTSLDLNAFFMLGEYIWLGGSYRMGVNLYEKDYLKSTLQKANSVVAAMELFPVKGLRVGYAYDFATGPLRGFAGSTHEVSIGFSFLKEGVKMVNPRVF